MGLSGPLPIFWRVPPRTGHDPQEWEGSAQRSTTHKCRLIGGGGQGSYQAVPLLPLALRVPALSPRPAPPQPPSLLPYGKPGRGSDGKAPPWGASMPPAGPPEGQCVWAGLGRQVSLPAPGGGAAGQAMGRRCRVSHDRCSCRAEGQVGTGGSGGGFAGAAAGGIVALVRGGRVLGRAYVGERRGRLCQPSSLGVVGRSRSLGGRY